MVTKESEKKFYDELEKVFVGADVDSDDANGYINLMKCKNHYYSDLKNKLKEKIDKKQERFGFKKEDLFNFLYNFFKDYFSDNGSIFFSYSHLKNKKYEEVYSEDKDVALFWKTHMLYYVKTDKLWRDMQVTWNDYMFNFSIGDVNKKANEKKEIFFEPESVDGKNIHIRVVAKNQSKSAFDKIIKFLKDNGIEIDEEELEKIFKQFKKQNDVDFFINKDAENFLKSQLDFYLKEFLLSKDTEFDEQSLTRVKAYREIAEYVIEAVGHFEDELVKIWNKPKFLKDSNYVLTLDKIKDKGEEVLKKIINSEGFEKQIQEWKELGIVDGDFKKEDLLN